MSSCAQLSAREALDAVLAATNTHDFDNVAEMLSEDVTYFFNDATLVGRDSVRGYFESTWELIHEERYWAEDVRWLIESDNSALVVYRYCWSGTIDGQWSTGSGRATNAFARDVDGRWLLVHEHLSQEPVAS